MMPATDMVTLTADRRGRPGDPCVMVIFGAAGDLTQRKLIPALYNLERSRLLSGRFAVVGFAREAIDSAEFRNRARRDLAQFATDEVDPVLAARLIERMHYVAGDFRDPEAYKRLESLLATIDAEQGTRGNYLAYLATPPELFS